jgi:hypothetical protein
MLEGLKPPSAYRSCKVSTVAQTLSDKDKEILLSAIADANNWPIVTLSRALQERGIMLSASPLTSHRAKACACFG